MARISKPPEVRRQEILDTAMELFAEKGYEDTSMADIARRMGVVQGLCYRYFDSKRVLFQEAMEQYVKECCAAGLPIIHDRSRTIRQRLDAMAELILRMEDTARHRAFYHRPGSQSFHTELNLRICEYLVPHVAEELSDACARGELRLEHPELTASYLLHGQIGLLVQRNITTSASLTFTVLLPSLPVNPGNVLYSLSTVVLSTTNSLTCPSTSKATISPVYISLPFLSLYGVCSPKVSGNISLKSP